MTLHQNEDGKWIDDSKVGRIIFNTTQAGWVCPKCQRVWAPWVNECVLCNLQTKTNEKDITEG